MRDFRLIWGGGFLNDVGDWLLLVALPVYVFTATGSGTATAALFVVELAVAVVLGPLGGSLVDRWNLRRTLVVTNVVQAATMLPLLAVTSHRIWPAIVVAAVQSALTQLNDPAKITLLTRLVAPEQLAVANAANSTGSSLARLIGSPLGGLAVALGGLHAVVVVDGASFLAVAAATLLVRADVSALPSTDAQARTPDGVRAGLHVIRDHRPLPALLGITGIAQIAQGFFTVLFVVFVVDELHGDGTQVGVIRGTMAVGAILGALLIARRWSTTEPSRILATGYVGMGVTSLLFWNAPVVSTALWLYVVLFALSGLPGSALGVGTYTTLQRSSPPAVVGRVVGAMGACSAAGTALGSLAAGILVDHLPLRPLLELQATIYLVCGVLVFVVITPRPAAEGDGVRAARPRGWRPRRARTPTG